MVGLWCCLLQVMLRHRLQLQKLAVRARGLAPSTQRGRTAVRARRRRLARRSLEGCWLLLLGCSMRSPCCLCWHLTSMIGGSARGRGRVRWVFVRLLVVAPMVVVHGAFSRARRQRAAQRLREAWKPSFPREFDTAYVAWTIVAACEYSHVTGKMRIQQQ